MIQSLLIHANRCKKMVKRIKHYIKEGILFFIVMGLFANLISYYKASELTKEPLDINYEFKNNEPVILHFWATWCPTCKLEISNIQKISKDYEVLTIVVNSGSNKDIREYMEKNNLNFRFINDNDKRFAKKFNISAYPTTFIYDKNKNLRFSEVGYTTTFGLYLRLWWCKFQSYVIF